MPRRTVSALSTDRLRDLHESEPSMLKRLRAEIIAISGHFRSWRCLGVAGNCGSQWRGPVRALGGCRQPRAKPSRIG